MDELISKASRGVDMSSPDAAWHLLHNMLAMVPWWPLFWFTVFSAVLGAVVGWWRGRLWFGIGMAVLIGPIACVLLLLLPKGRSARGGSAAQTPGSPPS